LALVLLPDRLALRPQPKKTGWFSPKPLEQSFRWQEATNPWA